VTRQYVDCDDGGSVSLSECDGFCKLECLAEYGEAYLTGDQCEDLAQKLMLIAERLREVDCGSC
jgi:hypothetical protein